LYAAGKENKKRRSTTHAMTSEGPQMTKKALRRLCIEKELYSTPELNEVLYLHYKGVFSFFFFFFFLSFSGWEKIENLEEYVQVSALWLEGNGFVFFVFFPPLKRLVDD
jgi:hypothetical protein